MPKAKTNAVRTTKVIDGVSQEGWEKVCPKCKKTYFTTSRTQKFCSDECRKKYNKRIYSTRKEYDKTKPLQRLKSRAHSLGVEVINQMVELGLREWKCEVCGEVHKLQVHHKDLNWLNNSSENLQVLCEKCHSQVHSDIDKKAKDEGLKVSDYYPDSIKPILEILNK